MPYYLIEQQLDSELSKSYHYCDLGNSRKKLNKIELIDYLKKMLFHINKHG